MNENRLHGVTRQTLSDWAAVASPRAQRADRRQLRWSHRQRCGRTLTLGVGWRGAALDDRVPRPRKCSTSAPPRPQMTAIRVLEPLLPRSRQVHEANGVEDEADDVRTFHAVVV